MKPNIVAFVLILIAAAGNSQAALYGDKVVSYDPGVLPSNLLSFTNAQAALGMPSQVTPGAYGGPVDPFNPPYLNAQLVSIGQGGSLEVGFPYGISNSPSNAYGLDFIIYGNAGFMITNGDFAGGGITDGKLFGQASAGSARVLVSPDHEKFYELRSALSPVVDGYFPTDGSGAFGAPVDPTLTGASFSGLGLAGIRAKYAGSAGGAGFDLAWAVDSQGMPVTLNAIHYLRIEVLNGHVDLDGFATATVVPEPSTWALGALGLTAWVGRRWLRRLSP